MSVPYSAWVNLGNRCELIPPSPPFKGRCHCIKTQIPIPKPNVPRRISHFFDSPASMFTEIFRLAPHRMKTLVKSCTR